MPDWVEAGRKADAHRVARLLSAEYSSWPKDVGRRKAIRSIKARMPLLVLDLWSGGNSAEAMIAVNLQVLSVDDGRNFKDVGVSTSRGRRALEICATEGGYQSGWGPALRFVAQADAAFLDFCSHWSIEIAQTLEACRHMRCVAVTLMPERAEFGNLTRHHWTVAYTALLEDALKMRVTWSHEYKRRSGRPAIVFFLKPTTRDHVVRLCEDCGGPRPSLAKRFCKNCARERTRSRGGGGLRSKEYTAKYNHMKREKFPEQRRAENHAWYLRNKERILAHQKIRYEATKPPLLSKEERSIRAKAGAALRNERRLAGVYGTPAEAVND